VAAPRGDARRGAPAQGPSPTGPKHVLLLPLLPVGPGVLPAGPAQPAWPDDAVRTLILTDLRELGARFDHAPQDPTMATLRRDVLALAAHDGVAGRVVWDLRADAGADVAAAYRAWAGNADPARWTFRANALALALRDWIRRQRATRHPGLRHIVIVGDDRIVPHLRLRIDAPFDRLDDGWVTETAYFQENTVGAGTAVGTALAEDMTLTDDSYGAAEPLAWGDQGLLHLPELAVGRLVERPADMSAAIRAFLRTGGDVTIARSLTACYDFMQDACAASDRLLEASGLPAADQRRLLGNGWTVDDLRAALRGEFDLFFYGVHAKHYVHETPSNGILYAAELAPLLGTRVRVRVAYGLACHTGLSTPGDHPEPTDFPETMVAAGVAFVASTGWAYGFDGEMQYQEKLLAGLTAELVQAPEPTFGEALVAAKRRYLLDADALDHLHAKTLAGTVLYGLPMTRVRLGDGDPAPTVARRDGAVAPATGAVGITEAAMPTDGGPYRRRVRAIVRARGLRRVSTPDGDWFRLADHAPRVQAGAPLQPQARHALGAVTLGGRSLAPRGAVLVGGRYRDIAEFRPLVRRARLLGLRPPAGAPAPVLSGGGWHPARLAPLAVLGDGAASQAMLHLILGQLHVEAGIERLYTALEVDVYYADGPDRAPPAVAVTAAAATAAGVAVSGSASDPSGIARVVIAWTIGDGRWRSTALTPDVAGRWRAALPPGAIAVVQAVDGAGNVAVVGDGGGIVGVPRESGPAPAQP